MQLPVQAPIAGKWLLWDYGLKRLKTGPADASGNMQVELPQVPDNELWLVDRIRVSSNSTKRSEVYLYENDAVDEALIDGSLSGNFDVADNNAPILLQAGVRLIFKWFTAQPTSVGLARVQWTVLRPAQVV